jgi:hypothetical protein
LAQEEQKSGVKSCCQTLHKSKNERKTPFSAEIRKAPPLKTEEYYYNKLHNSADVLLQQLVFYVL